MSTLPIFKGWKDAAEAFQLMQDKWASLLNPLLNLPLTTGHALKSVPLVSGANVINHGLGQPLQGWFLVRRRQWVFSGTPIAYDVSDLQDGNPLSALTLQLYSTQGTSGNPVLVDLWVY